MKLSDLRNHGDELGFTPRGPVRWLSPGELARTAVKVVLAEVFAGYSDKREIQAAFDSGPLRAPLREPDTATELWIDFVADLGDGFDATSTVAHAIAAEKITVTDADLEYQLSRGGVLVLGGDQVYPTASTQIYDDRFLGPYQSALPTSGDDPLLIALPGNHDWYDGLSSFLRLFIHGKTIGGWQTRQTRSYFVVRLPQHWWLVGLDTQLDNLVDEPQLEFFKRHLSTHLENGDGVIVCSAQPTWVSTAEDVDSFNSLHSFDRNIVRTRINPDTGEREPTGASIRIWLSGDRHHYARYAERLPGEQAEPNVPLPPDKRRRQMFTCGLGGAYLASTHRLPEDLPLPPRGTRMRDKDDAPLAFARAQVTYPDANTSRHLARRLAYPWSAYWLGRRNPGFPELAAGVHAASFLMLSVLFRLTEGTSKPINFARLAELGALGHFIGMVLGGIAVVLLLDRVARSIRGRKATGPPSKATAFILMQVMVALTILAVTIAIPWPAGWPGWIVLSLQLMVAGVLGAALGSEAFALSILSARSGAVAEWQMSGQAVEDHKGFLRLHIDPEGDLTVYPLVIDEVCHDWKLVDDPEGHKRPVPASPLPPPWLIESPVVVAKQVSAP